MESLDHRGRVVSRRPHHLQPVLAQRHHQALAADDQHGRTCRHRLRNQPRRCLGGGDHGGVFGLDAEVPQVLRDALGRTRRVVGDEPEPGTRLPAAGQPVAGPGESARPCVDDSVEVEQHQVVLRAQRSLGRAQRA